ncbi:MAG: M24 family metallopeptidase [Chloroflexota bacterium]|nr:M24 family metallopeptidase [Chloroflexota bacterium]
MKSYLDALMHTRDLAALIVAGDESANPARTYLSNGARITGGIILKVRGGAPVLVVNAMETDEAAKSGLQVLSYFDLGYADLVKAADGVRAKADAALWGALFRRFDVHAGRIGIYGTSDLSVFTAFLREIEALYPQYQFVGELDLNIFDEAYLTKDADEVLRIRSVAARTSEVLRETWDFIASHRADNERADAAVVDANGDPLTIRAVKRFMRRALFERELEEHGTIFAQGRDAAVPHSRGEDADILRVGQSIVFDLFPRESGGGYFHDCTRTWCIGYAPDAVQRLYDEVATAFQIALDEFEVGMPSKAMQEAVQTYFEGRGHATSRSTPGTTDGYVHSLGHGVGLNIHERPGLGHMSKDTLQHGNVISIEPGLYYPDQGIGVRIEDLFYIDARGELVNLTDFPHDLVLPLKG